MDQEDQYAYNDYMLRDKSYGTIHGAYSLYKWYLDDSGCVNIMDDADSDVDRMGLFEMEMGDDGYDEIDFSLMIQNVDPVMSKIELSVSFENGYDDLDVDLDLIGKSVPLRVDSADTLGDERDSSATAYKSVSLQDSSVVEYTNLNTDIPVDPSEEDDTIDWKTDSSSEDIDEFFFNFDESPRDLIHSFFSEAVDKLNIDMEYSDDENIGGMVKFASGIIQSQTHFIDYTQHLSLDDCDSADSEFTFESISSQLDDSYDSEDESEKTNSHITHLQNLIHIKKNESWTTNYGLYQQKLLEFYENPVEDLISSSLLKLLTDLESTDDDQKINHFGLILDYLQLIISLQIIPDLILPEFFDMVSSEKKSYEGILQKYSKIHYYGKINIENHMSNYIKDDILLNTIFGELFFDISEQESVLKFNTLSEMLDLFHHSVSNTKWNLKFQDCLCLPEYDDEKKLLKYRKLSLVANDFLYVAESLANIIVTEVGSPNSLKTIKSSTKFGKNQGRYFLCNGILFKIALDLREVKVASHELKGLTAFFHCTDYNLIRVPLACTIDYKGFRVVALSWIDTFENQYIHDDLISGNSYYTTVMRNVSELLHVNSVRENDVFIPHESLMIQGKDQRIYIDSVGKLIPPEPFLTSDKLQTDNVRLLRPELLLHLGVSLAPSAFDEKYGILEYQHLRNEINFAVRILKEEIIPKFAEDWSDEISSSPKVLISFRNNITQYLHGQGINIRHLGLIRKHSRNLLLSSALLDEMISRIIKNDLKKDLRQYQKQTHHISQEPYKRITVQKFNMILHDPDYWVIIRKKLIKKFSGSNAPKEREMYPINLKEYCSMYYIFDRIGHLTGIHIDIDALRLSRIIPDMRFLISDIMKFGTKVKHMNVINLAWGIELSMRAKTMEPSQADRLLRLSYEKFRETAESSLGFLKVSIHWANAHYTHAMISTSTDKSISYLKKALKKYLEEDNDALISRIANVYFSLAIRDHQKTYIWMQKAFELFREKLDHVNLHRIAIFAVKKPSQKLISLACSALTTVDSIMPLNVQQVKLLLELLWKNIKLYEQYHEEAVLIFIKKKDYVVLEEISLSCLAVAKKSNNMKFYNYSKTVAEIAYNLYPQSLSLKKTLAEVNFQLAFSKFPIIDMEKFTLSFTLLEQIEEFDILFDHTTDVILKYQSAMMYVENSEKQEIWKLQDNQIVWESNWILWKDSWAYASVYELIDLATLHITAALDFLEYDQIFQKVSTFTEYDILKLVPAMKRSPKFHEQFREYILYVNLMEDLPEEMIYDISEYIFPICEIHLTNCSSFIMESLANLEPEKLDTLTAIVYDNDKDDPWFPEIIAKCYNLKKVSIVARKNVLKCIAHHSTLEQITVQMKEWKDDVIDDLMLVLSTCKHLEKIEIMRDNRTARTLYSPISETNSIIRWLSQFLPLTVKNLTNSFYRQLLKEDYTFITHLLENVNEISVLPFLSTIDNLDSLKLCIEQTEMCGNTDLLQRLGQFFNYSHQKFPIQIFLNDAIIRCIPTVICDRLRTFKNLIDRQDFIYSRLSEDSISLLVNYVISQQDISMILTTKESLFDDPGDINITHLECMLSEIDPINDPLIPKLLEWDNIDDHVIWTQYLIQFLLVEKYRENAHRKLASLERLKISWMPSIMMEDITLQICQYINPHIKNIEITNKYSKLEMDEQFAINLMVTCSSLESLSINFRTNLSDEFLYSLQTANPNITALTIRSSNFTSSGLSELFENCTKIRVLMIELYLDRSNVILNSICQNLSKLKELWLMGWDTLDFNKTEKTLLSTPTLESIHFINFQIDAISLGFSLKKKNIKIIRHRTYDDFPIPLADRIV